MTETREKIRSTYLMKAQSDGEINIDNNRIKYVNAQGSIEQNYLDPEEEVRAKVFSELLYRYKYKSKNIHIEKTVPLQPDDVFADIAIYDSKDKNKVFAVIELKKENAPKKEKIKAIKEQYSYALLLGAQYYIYDCNKSLERKAFATYGADSDPSKLWGSKERVQNIVHDLPIDYGKVLEWNYIKGDKEHSLIPISNIELYDIFKKCHDILWEGGKKDPAEAFDEMSKIIFVKSMDEYKTRKNKPYSFQIGNHETNDKLAVANRVKQLFEDVKSDKEHVFMEDVSEDDEGNAIREPSRIKSRNDRLYKIVSLMQSVDLKNTDLDAKGRAFEQFLETVFKSKLGQYFTHRNIVNFCIQIIDPNEGDKIIDPSCGSGGFLLHSLVYVGNKIQEEYDLTDIDDLLEYKSKYKDFAEKCLYGIEKNEKIARVAMMDMVIYEDGSTNIEDNDGLIDFSMYKNNKLKKGKGAFNIVLTNPPFGSKVDNEELDNFNNFSLGGENRNQQASDILFVERNIDFMQPNFSNAKHKFKPGGKMAIVLPDGILNNSTLWYVRQLIQESCYVRAIVSLPNFAFKKTGSGSKTSLIFLKKFTIGERKKYISDKIKYLPDKQKHLEKIKASLSKKISSFIKDNNIETILENIYSDIISIQTEFNERVNIETKKVDIKKEDGSIKKVDKQLIDRTTITDADIDELISSAQDLFKLIGKTDNCLDDNEEDPSENLIRYFDEIQILGKFFLKFIEPAKKIIMRQKRMSLRMTTKNYEVIDLPKYKILLEYLNKAGYKVDGDTENKVREVFQELKGINDKHDSELNPLWFSNSNQVNDKNIVIFLKYCGFDILVQFQKQIRQLEILLEVTENYKSDFEAHKEVMKDWNYPVFYAGTNRIGYDATGRNDRNELYKEEWQGEGDNMQKNIDPYDENTILGRWNKFKTEQTINF